jgi:hypothetical protein
MPVRHVPPEMLLGNINRETKPEPVDPKLLELLRQLLGADITGSEEVTDNQLGYYQSEGVEPLARDAARALKRGATPSDLLRRYAGRAGRDIELPPEPNPGVRRRTDKE